MITDNPTANNKIMTNGTKIRRTEITIETKSLTIIRINGKRQTAFCECCQKVVAAFAPEQVAGFSRLSLAEVCRRVEAKQIHLTRTERSAALICGNSLEGKEN